MGVSQFVGKSCFPYLGPTNKNEMKEFSHSFWWSLFAFCASDLLT